MTWKILVFFALNVYSHEAKPFAWRKQNNFGTASNWLNKRQPCPGDHIHIDSLNEVATAIDINLDVAKILFPTTGVMFFGKGVSIGADKQESCPERADADEYPSPEVYFEDDEFLSVFDPASWASVEPRDLHMNQIPSQKDDVTIDGNWATQMMVEDTWYLRSLNIAGRVGA
ncbi:unnamed protein product, partial [Mesorhabditis spiculigera]